MDDTSIVMSDVVDAAKSALFALMVAAFTQHEDADLRIAMLRNELARFGGVWDNTARTAVFADPELLLAFRLAWGEH